jgi:uncharacterized damage-inducible protein DinB
LPITDLLLPEFDHEMGVTRRLLQRVPDADLAWTPHGKSMTLGQLSTHLAELPRWTRTIMREAFYDLESGGTGPRLRSFESIAEVLGAFDRHVAQARALLAGAADAELLAPWSLRRGAHELFTVPRIAAIRSFIVNHAIHHRGQLSVYLRLRDVPLPAIYGPSADEGL